MKKLLTLLLISLLLFSVTVNLTSCDIFVVIFNGNNGDNGNDNGDDIGGDNTGDNTGDDIGDDTGDDNTGDNGNTGDVEDNTEVGDVTDGNDGIALPVSPAPPAAETEPEADGESANN